MSTETAVIFGAVASAASTVIHALGSVTCQIIRCWKQPVTVQKPAPPKPPEQPKP